MWIAIGVIGALAVIFIFLVFVPVEVTARVSFHGKPKLTRLVWLYGLFDKEITGEKGPEAKKKPRKFKINDFLRISEIIRVKGLIRKIKNLVFDIIRTLKFRDITTECKIGTGNPACTGMLFGILMPAVFVINNFSRFQLDLCPSWDNKPVLERSLAGKARLMPLQLFIPLTRFVFTRPVFTAAVKMVRSKWKKKK